MTAKRSSNNNSRVLTPSSPPWYKTKPRKCSRRKLEFFLYVFFCASFIHMMWYDIFFPKSSSINHLMCLLCIYFYAFFVLFFFINSKIYVCPPHYHFLHMMWGYEQGKKGKYVRVHFFDARLEWVDIILCCGLSWHGKNRSR